MKKKPKILIVMMLIIALVGCSPAWAEEGESANAVVVTDDSGDSIGDSSAVLSDEVGELLTEPGESGDTGDAGSSESGGSAGNAVGANDGIPTVNVSTESVKAIADAVNTATYTYEYQYTIVTASGETFIIDTDCATLMENYLVAVNYTGSSYTILFQADGQYQAVRYSDTRGALQKTGDDYIYEIKNLTSGQVVSTKETWFGGTSGSGTSTLNLPLQYCNRNLVDMNTGEIIYASGYDEPLQLIVTFDTGESGLSIPSQSVYEADDIVLPEVEALEGFVFEGWFADSAYTQPFALEGLELTSNITVYGKFTPIPLVSFVFPFEELTAEPQYINNLQLPKLEYEGYTFVGWYLDEEYTQAYSSTIEVVEDITLYAKYAESSPMSVFSNGIFNGLTALFEVEAIKYILAIMALVIIFGAIKILTSFKG